VGELLDVAHIGNSAGFRVGNNHWLHHWHGGRQLRHSHSVEKVQEHCAHFLDFWAQHAYDFDYCGVFLHQCDADWLGPLPSP
jgi:hypothetical protein